MSYRAFVATTRPLSRATILLSLTVGVVLVAFSAQASDVELSPSLQLSVEACARRQGTTPEARINSCSQAMESSSLVGLARADAYLNRGEAYMATGNHARALADYDESMRLRALHEAGV
jgi:hypothetical protein